MTELGIQDWLKAAVDAALELGSEVLGFRGASVLPTALREPPAGQGSYVALQGPGYSVHIGLISDLAGCMDLARALLRLSPEDEVTQDDVVDAVGELANMLAGGVKKRLIEREPKQQLGLPIFIDGKIRPAANMETAVGTIVMGPIRVDVLVVRSSNTLKPAR